MKHLKISLLFLVTALIISCNSDDNGNEILPEGDFVNGAFVLNEGGYNHGNASVSFINAQGEIENNIYESVNGMGLGDVAQSISFDDELAYIVVNNSNTVEVVNRYTFKRVGTIAGELNNPRYMVFENGKGYISNWGDGANAEDDFIAVVDLSNFSVLQKISVPQGPERMIEENGKLYVAQRGDYGSGNSVTVINLTTNTISGSIEVGDVPNGMIEEDGYLYVICSGKGSWTGDETLGGLYKINLQNNQIVDSFTFEQGVHPSYLQEENSKLYYTIGNDIYQTETADIEPSTPYISTSNDGMQTLYGFNVDNGWIYACDAKDYVGNGDLYAYTLSGTLESKYPIGGVLPNGVYFND